MSHVSDIKLKVMNLDLLRQAAEKLGLIMRSQETYRWYGRHVGDYPLPEGFTKEDLGKCTYALSVPGNDEAFEVGVVARPDGSYTLLWDFWNGGFGLEEAIGKDGEKLIEEYEALVFKQVAIEQGYEVSETVDSNGVRTLEAVQY